MKTRTTFLRHLLLLPLACAAFANHAVAANILITSPLKETYGTLKTLIAPNLSGTADNTTDGWVFTTGPTDITRALANTVGGFNVTIDGIAQFMTVEATGSTGGVLPANDSLMVVQTVNSQTLTDAATLSVYMRPATSTPWSLDLSFRFWDDYNSGSKTFSNPLATTVQLTSLDLDYNQLYYIKNSDTASWNISAGSAVTTPATPAYSGYTGFTAAGDSLYNDATHAVTSRGFSDDTYSVKFGHNAVALFMLEFRDPSTIVPIIPTIPEPSFAFFGSFTLLALLRRRR